MLRTGKLAYYKDDRVRAYQTKRRTTQTHETAHRRACTSRFQADLLQEYSLSRVINLRTIHTAAPVKIKKHSFTFGIVTKQRTFLAEASSQSEMDDWVAAITNARRRVTEEAERRANPAPAHAAAPNQMQVPNTAPVHINSSANAMGGRGSGLVSPTTASPLAQYSSGLNMGGEGGQGAGEMTMSPAQLHPSVSQGLPEVHYPSPTYGGATPISIGQASQQQQQQQGQGTRRNPSMSSQTARSARREPSASSLSSSAGHNDYFPRNATASSTGTGTGLAPPIQPSSSASAGQSPMSQNHSLIQASPRPYTTTAGAGQISSDSEDLDDVESHANFSEFGTSVGTGFSHSYMDNMGLGLGHAQAQQQAPGQGQGQGQGGMARSPSAGLTLNLNVPGTGKTITSQAAAQGPGQMSAQTPVVQTPSPFANVDPSRVIMSGYLMKRSHGRGRKVWRKRWWILTSAGLTYAKSHMVRPISISPSLLMLPSVRSAALHALRGFGCALSTIP